jgi:hypothetical protein
MGLRPTQGDEKRLLFSNYCPRKHCPPLCHLDRSAAEWRDLRCGGPFLEMFFDGVGGSLFFDRANAGETCDFFARYSLARY